MAKLEKIWKELTIEDLTGDLKEIAEALGMDAALYFVQEWGRTTLYIPSPASFITTWKERQIVSRWNGHNTGELAKEFDVTRRYIFDLLKREKPGVKDPAQATLF